MQSIMRLHPDVYSGITVSDLDDADLSILIQLELADAEITENGLEHVGDFVGGLVIEIDDNTSILPTCCGSMSDYKNWVELLVQRPDEWTEIWIGHPWVFGRVKGELIQLTDYRDETMPPPDETLVKYEFDSVEFKVRMGEGVAAIQALKKRVFTILQKEQNPDAVALSELLIENEIHQIQQLE